jgi:hypothetical protein
MLDARMRTTESHIPLFRLWRPKAVISIRQKEYMF